MPVQNRRKLDSDREGRRGGKVRFSRPRFVQKTELLRGTLETPGRRVKFGSIWIAKRSERERHLMRPIRYGIKLELETINF